MMKRALCAILFCIGVYAFSLLALTALAPVLDRLPAFAGGTPIARSAVPMTLPVLHGAAPIGQATPVGQALTPSAVGSGVAGIVLWLLPLPPDVLVTILYLRGLLGNRRAHSVVPLWRVS